MPGLFPNYQELDPKKALDNLTKAMDIGEKHLGIKPVITPSQLADGEIDELSLATYLVIIHYSWLDSVLILIFNLISIFVFIFILVLTLDSIIMYTHAKSYMYNHSHGMLRQRAGYVLYEL